MKWHTMSVNTVLEHLKTSKEGLSNEEVKKRIEKYGLNIIEKKKRRTALKIFFSQFKSILVILLLIATLLTLFLKMYLDAVVIGAILLINAFLGFHQEYKAEKSVEALKKLIVSKVLVIRNGEKIEVKAEELVPGDIVILEEGKRIPADLRLIESINLRVDESTLTGESVPVEKSTKIMKDVPLSERKNMVFSSTLVVSGRGKGVVVETGPMTEIGKIAKMIEEIEEPTPLQTKLQNFGKFLSLIIILIALLIFSLGFLKGINTFEIFLTSISLAVSAVPEGLPAVVTSTLAIGTRKMAKRNCIVKRLAAVEALGSVTVIAADKTGTMTTNEMTVRKVWYDWKVVEVSGVGFEREGDFKLNGKRINPKEDENLYLLLKISKMCNNSILKKTHLIGDPTEGALKILALKGKVDEEYERVDEIPFSSERKIMTTIHKIDEKYVAYTKGAPEIVLKLCDKIYPNKKLSKKEREKIEEVIKDLAEKGLRVLGFSFKNLEKSYSKKEVEKNMIFVGLAAMIDPPRKETAHAIKLCKEAGIRVIMITGDHKLTAKAIASEIGLEGEVMTGSELEKISDEELEEIVDEITIYARVSPHHKLRIVNALKKKGHIVAVTGDGVNDAPALKKADVGIAMGIKGTDVAKEAADMILLDDNFSTIVNAIEEGRGIYDNIKKFVRFLLSANFDEIMIVASSILLSLPLPLLPLQILWINLVTDSLPALSLGVDPKEKGIMKRKPRDPKESILSSSLLFLFVASILAFFATFYIFTTELENGIEKARTMTLTTTILFEMFFVFNCRSEEKSVFRKNPLTNKKLIISILISIILQILIIYSPFFQEIFSTTPLNLQDWFKIIMLSALGLLVLPEIFIKHFYIK
ncbi:MAG: cation-translocating P-type ATPase [Candidatus Heimdallarchaeaceae archaeon]